ncbi:MAG TPA: hypothetical protein VHE09_14890 [Rhizomicrobium sp.]|jgi:hypothetical protein|nr:hypothetical protein [Rhizomicrobium sp.]
MNEDRKQILDMLASGRITAEEAERLIAALERNPSSGTAAPTRTFGSSKYLRIQVEREPDPGDDAQTRVNIRVPIQLLRAGVKLKSLLPEDARDQMNDAMREKGVKFDINQFKPENLDEMLANLNDLSIDVDKKSRKAKIRIFCE